MDILNNNTVKVRFDVAGDSYLNGGNVGIGTTTPIAKLSLQGTAGDYDLFDLASSTGTSVKESTSQGNIGIGTTGPGATLM